MSKLTVAPPNKESFGRRSADCAPVILRRPGTRSWSMSSSKYSAKQIRNARRRFKSQPEGFNCVIRGRCYMKPLLGSNPRIRKKRSQDSRILPFGEIEYLKRKMGFTLPSAESIVKSAKFTSQPKGKLSRQSAADRRLAEVLVDVEMTEMKKRSRLNSKKSNAYSSITTPRVYSTVAAQSSSRTALHMARSRNQMTTRIDFLLRNMPRSLWEMGKSLDRAVVVQGSGTVMTYTRDQLDSFHPIDEETINAVKRRLKKDKMTAVKQTPRRGTRCRLSLAAEQSIAGNTTLTSYTEGFDPFFGSLDMTIKRKTSYTTSSDLYKI